jgi:hypothetical protein
MTTPIDPLHSPGAFRRRDRFQEDRPIEGATAPQSAGQRFGDGKETARRKPSVISIQGVLDEPSEPIEGNPTQDGTSVDYDA